MDCLSLLEEKVTRCFIRTVALTFGFPLGCRNAEARITVVRGSELEFAKEKKKEKICSSYGLEDLSVVRAEEFDYPLQLLALKLYPVHPCTPLYPSPMPSCLVHLQTNR